MVEAAFVIYLVRNVISSHRLRAKDKTISLITPLLSNIEYRRLKNKSTFSIRPSILFQLQRDHLASWRPKQA